MELNRRNQSKLKDDLKTFKAWQAIQTIFKNQDSRLEDLNLIGYIVLALLIDYLIFGSKSCISFMFDFHQNNQIIITLI